MDGTENVIPMEGVSMESVDVKRDIPVTASRDVTVSLIGMLQ